MLQYIYPAVAVLVLLGVLIVGFMLIRRGRRADREELELAMAADPANAGDAATSDLEAPVMAEPESAVAPSAVPSKPEGPAQSDYLEEVDQLLVGWRAAHGSASSNGRSERQSVSVFWAEPESPVPVAAVPLPNAPAHSASGNGSAVKELLADPLGVVILDMLDGDGKLSGQELKKLEVFRPERVQFATRTMELPPRFENDEDVVLRLAQIQLYAATLELRAKWASQISRPGGGTLPDVPFSARDFKLKMARDIMALPASDRSEVIGFLLGGFLAADGSSPELKRAVIDTLEHLHSAALVNVLLDCLDDPDPIVQEYALAAADRLLDE